MTILIVNRDYDMRTILATMLRSQGYDVRELGDPDCAVEEAQDCDIAIIDHPTPTRTGDTVTRLLRRSSRSRRIKILNATTRAFAVEIQEAIAAGVDATVVLPASLGEVVAAVRGLLPHTQDPEGSALTKHWPSSQRQPASEPLADHAQQPRVGIDTKVSK